MPPRHTFVAAVTTAFLSACAVAPSEQAPAVRLPITFPEGLTFEKYVEASSTQLRGPSGQLWLVTVYRDTPLTANQTSGFSAESLRQWRGDVPSVKRRLRDSEHLIREIEVDQEGVLVLVARQTSLVGAGENTGRAHSYVEFQIHWPKSQPSRLVKGSVEWEGPLYPLVTEVLEKLRNVRPRDT